MPIDPLELLKDLVAIPSVNPMGRDVSGPEFFETRLSEYLVEFFEQRGIDCERIEVVPGRANVIARIESGDDRPTIVLDAHQDTVPVDGMTIPPFEAKVESGRLTGRGACDVKGGLAAMLAAAARLADERPAGAYNVVVSCTCDEEATVMGISDLVRLWTDDDRNSRLLPSKPDAAVVAEPTELDIVVAHRGATRWKIRTTGVACHSSRPGDGINAIYRMARVIECLEEYAGGLADRVDPHPLCGPATMSVGRIEGGASVNVVPDECLIEVDRRVIPGEDGAAVIDDVAEFLRERIDFDVEFLPPWLIGLPLPNNGNTAWAERLLEHVEVAAGPRRLVGVPYGTHASRFAASGVPAIVFGPGSIAQAHTKDEFIEIDQLRLAAEIYFQFCAEGGQTVKPPGS